MAEFTQGLSNARIGIPASGVPLHPVAVTGPELFLAPMTRFAVIGDGIPPPSHNAGEAFGIRVVHAAASCVLLRVCFRRDATGRLCRCRGQLETTNCYVDVRDGLANHGVAQPLHRPLSRHTAIMSCCRGHRLIGQSRALVGEWGHLPAEIALSCSLVSHLPDCSGWAAAYFSSTLCVGSS